MTISVAQKDELCFARSSGYNYSYTRLMLLRIIDRQNLEFESVAAINDNQRDLHLEIEALEPGEYHIFAELDWNTVGSEAPKF